MMKKNRWRSYISLLCLIFMIPTIFMGCFNYNDINKVTFPTSIIFDVNDLNQVVVYLDCIKPYRSTNESSDKGRRIIYKGEGKTTLEALKDITRVSSYRLNYSQTRAYIFTEKAARDGIKKYIDLINSDNGFQTKPSAFIYYGDVEDLLKTASTDEEYLGLFLNDLVEQNRDNPRSVESNINYYLTNRLMGSNVSLLTSIGLKDNAIDKKVEIDGASILRDNVLVDKMDLSDSLTYNLIMGTLRSGTLEVVNPQANDSLITLEVLATSVRENLVSNGEKLELIKDIEIEVAIGEVQGKLLLTQEVMDYIKYSKETYINGYCEFVFNKYKDKGLDIFNVGRMAEIHYPKEVIINPLSKTDIKVNTTIKIKGTGTIKNVL